MEFELHAPEPVGDVGVVYALDEDFPGVGVVVGDPGGFGVAEGVEGAGGGAVDEGAVDGEGFDAFVGFFVGHLYFMREGAGRWGVVVGLGWGGWMSRRNCVGNVQKCSERFSRAAGSLRVKP